MRLAYATLSNNAPSLGSALWELDLWWKEKEFNWSLEAMGTYKGP